MTASTSTIPHRRPRATSPRRGFTLVEMLVVIGVIAILLGLLLTGLRAAIGAGGKTRELSALRQLFYGWSMYSSANEEKLMPGFLDVNTQQLWGVEYRDHAKTKLNRQLTQAWPWRLAPYVDYSWEVLCGYRDDWEKSLAAVPPEELQNEPFFGYNALYVGGWWTAPNPSGPALPRFDNYVTRSAGAYSRPDSMIVFSGSTLRGPGVYKPNKDEKLPGAHWVSPPNQAMTAIWRAGGFSAGSMFPLPGQSHSLTQTLSGTSGSLAPGSIEVLQEAAVPLNRFGPAVAVLNADGGTSSDALNQLMDMRRWVDAATTRDWKHPE